MNKEPIKEFLYQKSEDEASWFTGINALYSKTSATNLETSKLSKETIKCIGKKSKFLETELKEINESEKPKSKKKSATKKKTAKTTATNATKRKQNLFKWRRVVIKIKYSYNKYIESIKNFDLNYLVISEAPMLNYESMKKNFSCNYVFWGNTNVGSYRKVPYQAFGGDKDKPTGQDLMEIFEEKKVGFFDLIPIPLPKIDRDLRHDWSQNKDYNIEGLPRTVYFLKTAFEEFINKANCTLNDNLKIILMMPPNTAMGIISFYLNDGKTGNAKLDNLSNKFIIQNSNCVIIKNTELKGVPVRLHRQIVMNGSGGPDLKLFNHAL